MTVETLIPDYPGVSAGDAAFKVYPFADKAIFQADRRRYQIQAASTKHSVKLHLWH